MKCTICGAKLKKEGELCNNCYKEFQEDEDLKNDVNEVFKFKRKYSIKYEMRKYLELFIIFTICLVVFFMAGNIAEFLLTLLILAIILGFALFVDKRIANGTQATFYEKKVVYTFKFFIFNKRKVVKYKDIQDISCYQTFRQKKLGMGDICIYAKGVFPGATLLNGFQVKDVENVAQTIQTIKEIIKT